MLKFKKDYYRLRVGTTIISIVFLYNSTSLYCYPDSLRLPLGSSRIEKAIDSREKPVEINAGGSILGLLDTIFVKKKLKTGDKITMPGIRPERQHPKTTTGGRYTQGQIYAYETVRREFKDAEDLGIIRATGNWVFNAEGTGHVKEYEVVIPFTSQMLERINKADPWIKQIFNRGKMLDREKGVMYDLARSQLYAQARENNKVISGIKVNEDGRVQLQADVPFSKMSLDIGAPFINREISLIPFDGDNWDSGFRVFYRLKEIAVYESGGDEELILTYKSRPSAGTVLVPGGSGFIGSHTIQELLRQGYDVVCLDSLVKGRQYANERNANFANAMGRKFTFIKGDFGDEILLESIFQKYDIDIDIVFSAFIQVGESVDHPALYFWNNIINTLKFLMVQQKLGVKIRRDIFSSSAGIYNDPVMPLTENSLVAPAHPYGFTKATMERLYRIFSNIYVALRYFNPAGASIDQKTEKFRLREMHDIYPESHLIPIVIERLLKGESVMVTGLTHGTTNRLGKPDGSQARDYFLVDDVLTTAHLAAAEIPSESVNQPYNVGSGTAYTVIEIVETVADVLDELGYGIRKKFEETNTRLWIDKGAMRGKEPAVLKADTTKFQGVAKDIFGNPLWYPSKQDPDVLLRDMIKLVVTTYQPGVLHEEMYEKKPTPSMDEVYLEKQIEKEFDIALKATYISESQRNELKQVKDDVLKQLKIYRQIALARLKTTIQGTNFTQTNI